MFETPYLEWLPVMAGMAFPFGVNLLAHSAALILAGLLAARALRSRGAAVESLVLRLTLVAVLVSPVASLTAGWLEWPGLTMPTPAFVRNMAPEPVPETPVTPGTGPNHAPAIIGEGIVVSSPVAASRGGSEPGPSMVRNDAAPSIADTVLPALVVGAVTLWAFLSLFLLGRLFVCLLMVRRIRRSAVDAAPETIRACKELSDILGVDAPLVLQSRFVRSPFLTGVFQPVVLLPVTGRENEPVGREVLLHELAHLVRRDCFWNLLAQGAAALLPLQPLMRVLTRNIEDVSDDVCDDYVMQCGSNPHTYARQLYAVAERFRPSTPELLIGVGIVTFKSSLGRRIERILDSSREFAIRPGAGTVIRVAGFCAVLTLLVGLTGVRGIPILESPIIVPPLVMPEEPDLLHRPVSRIKNASSPLKTPVAPPSVETEARSPLNGLPERGQEAVPADGLNPEQTMATQAEEQASNMSAVKEPSFIEPETLRHAASQSGDAWNPPDIAPEIPEQGASEPEVQTVLLEQSGNRSVRSSLVLPEETPVPTVEFKDVRTAMRTAEQAVESGKYAEAEAALVWAMGRDPQDPEVMNRLGRVYFLKRDYGKAAACLQTAIARKSNFADAHYNMGDVLLAQGQLDAAMKEYKTAIRYNSAYARRTRALF